MAWQGNGMGAAWKRHAMCESALSEHRGALFMLTSYRKNMPAFKGKYLLHEKNFLRALHQKGGLVFSVGRGRINAGNPIVF